MLIYLPMDPQVNYANDACADQKPVGAVVETTV